MAGEQVKNGKAFEYALATQYVDYLRGLGLAVEIKKDAPFEIAKNYFYSRTSSAQTGFMQAASQTIETLIKLEPGLTAQKNSQDRLLVSLAPDSDGETGDVRDVVFERPSVKWEVGFSAKNNNDAVKHSRLSKDLDFGKRWLGVPCSKEYWQKVSPIFDYLTTLKDNGALWENVPDKAKSIYIPILLAFREELLMINDLNPNIPEKLIEYLIGTYPFYKIIKDDSHNLVIVKAFNLKGLLGKRVNGMVSRYKTPKLNYPKRIVEFEFKENSDNTLNMILDQGWEISFRIHSAEKKVIPSLKFDIQLIGNPPILFTQHIFQD